MSIVCVILDSQPDYLADRAASSSLLSMPLGPGTILSEIIETAQKAGCSDIRVLPCLPHADNYWETIRRIAPATIRAADGDIITSLIHEYEPSDHVLVIDPRYWSISGLDLDRTVRGLSQGPSAVHRVAMRTSSDEAQEFVHCDDNGHVTRILRYYEDVTCSGIDAIEYSLVPLAPMLEGVRFDSLGQLRSTLTARGMMSRDLIDRFGVIDLADEKGYLALNEQRVVEASFSAPLPGLVEMRSGVFVGRDCSIEPSAELIEPIIIQDRVTIERGASVIGPAVIGEGCRLGASATIAQSVLARDTTIDSEQVVHHRVACGRPVNPLVGSPDVDLTPPVRDRLVRLGADASVMREVREVQNLVVVLKLWIDRVVAGVSLILLSPLFLFTAIAVKLDSSGPVFFGHEREGRFGKVFRCLKFRTMGRDAHQKQRELYAANKVDGPQFKLDQDPRVTRVGRWLRSTNIDELPQLINVFLGQMSIVGPRPSPFRENQICVPWRRARLSVRPGITGLWQICRDQRSEGDFHQWITYDIMYVRNLSLWLDAKILIATMLTLGGLWSVPQNWLVHDKAFDRQESSPTGSSVGEAA